ncbi:MAG: SAM-dependent methyltransferase, partial [Candidatus Competibacteraceae bacterium]|nr:SAM-dependent methyltransferase [Candidatus Competibacteraceae bacterium]
PNPIGLSAARLERVTVEGRRVALSLAGVDLLDGTPVLDIKPYLPYADRIADATGGFAAEAPAPALAVSFSPAAAAVCAAWPRGNLRELIEQLLAQNPRPAYRRDHPDPQRYGMKLYQFDVRWEQRDGAAHVTDIAPDAPEPPILTPAPEPPRPADRTGSLRPEDR